PSCAQPFLIDPVSAIGARLGRVASVAADGWPASALVATPSPRSTVVIALEGLALEGSALEELTLGEILLARSTAPPINAKMRQAKAPPQLAAQARRRTQQTELWVHIVRSGHGRLLRVALPQRSLQRVKPANCQAVPHRVPREVEMSRTCRS